MLLKFYRQSYQTLLDKLLELQKQILAEDIDIISIKSIYQEVEAIFQHQILSVRLDELNCNAIALIRSAQTEIHKNLRLLNTELVFLSTSRQAQTTARRLEKIQEKIQDLIGYSQGVISQLDQ